MFALQQQQVYYPKSCKVAPLLGGCFHPPVASLSPLARPSRRETVVLPSLLACGVVRLLSSFRSCVWIVLLLLCLTRRQSRKSGAPVFAVSEVRMVWLVRPEKGRNRKRRRICRCFVMSFGMACTMCYNQLGVAVKVKEDTISSVILKLFAYSKVNLVNVSIFFIFVFFLLFLQYTQVY